MDFVIGGLIFCGLFYAVYRFLDRKNRQDHFKGFDKVDEAPKDFDPDDKR